MGAKDTFLRFVERRELFDIQNKKAKSCGSEKNIYGS